MVNTIQAFNHWCSSNYFKQQNITFQWLNRLHYRDEQKSTRHCLVRVTCFSHWKLKSCYHRNENDCFSHWKLKSCYHRNENDKIIINMTTFPFYFSGHDIWLYQHIGPLEMWQWYSKSVISAHMSQIKFMGTSYETALRWQNTFDDKSTLVLVITRANADPDLCRHMSSLGHNELRL